MNANETAKPGPGASCALLRLGLTAVLLGLVGCLSQPTTQGTDPLTGGTPIPKQGPGPGTARGASGAPVTTAPGPLPALPAPSGTTSQAALAVGIDQSLDPAPSLRIQGDKADGGWRGQSGTPTIKLAGPQPADTLGGHGGLPEALPVTLPTVVPATARSAPTPVAAGAVDTYAAAQEALASRGVTWQQLETTDDPGVWRFRCWVPDRKTPTVHQTYDVRAPGEYGVAAIRAALQEIDKDAH